MQEYIEIDLQIHWLSQILAKVNKAFVPPRKDDSHSNLFFDIISKRVMGRWISTPSGRVLLALNLSKQKFEWLNARLECLAYINIFDTELIELERNVTEYIMGMGLNTKKTLAPMHYEMPSYNIQSITKDAFSEKGVNRWCQLRHVANCACFEVLGYFQSRGDVRIWPHHFDTGVYTQITDTLGIGFGLAMADALVDEPYFYFSGYSSGTQIKYHNLPILDSGRWITEGDWNGTILYSSAVEGFSTEQGLNKIRSFAITTSDWFLQK